MIKMKNNIYIAIIGLGQIGLYLYNELKAKKKEIEIKTGKKNSYSCNISKKQEKKKKI